MRRLQSKKFFLLRPKPALDCLRKKLPFLVVDPTEKISTSEYSQLSQSGFRRGGKTIYRPQRECCEQCIPIRIPVENFIPKRRHRRVLSKNSRVSVSKVNPFFSVDHFRLYFKYINYRHNPVDMGPSSVAQYRDFFRKRKTGS